MAEAKKIDTPPDAVSDKAVNPELRKALETGDYDFLDLGSSTGGSFKLAQGKFQLKAGVGVDIDPQKVAKAREAGFQVFQQDATKLHLLPDSIKVVILSHFLEHLPSATIATRCIQGALAAATDYVFIRQPFFDSDGPLMMQGFKMYYADWRGHQNHMTTYDVWQAFQAALDRREIHLAILGRWPLQDSAAEWVVSLDAPPEIKVRELGAFQSKTVVAFDFPLFRELVAVAVKLDDAGRPRADWRDLVARLGNTTVLKVFGE